MLYLDERVEIPKTRAYVNGPYIYYRLSSYLTKDGKERHHQRCIGRLFVDEKNQRWLIPNDFYYELFKLPLPAAGTVKRRGPAGAAALKPEGSRCNAFTLSVIAALRELKLCRILKSVLDDDGNTHSCKAAAIIAYYLQCDGNNSLAGFRRFSEENFSLLLPPFDGSGVLEEFKHADLLRRESLERRWLEQLPQPKALLCCEVPSLFTYSERVDGAFGCCDGGEDSLSQLNLALVYSAESYLPLFITLGKGPLHDAVRARLKALRLADRFDLIFSGCSRERLIFCAEHGLSVMMPCSYRRSAAVRAAVLEHRSELEAGTDSLTVLKGGAVASTRVPFCIDGVKGSLLIYLDYEKHSLQTAAVVSKKEYLEAKLKELTCCPRDLEQYEPYFSVKSAEGGRGFTYSVDALRFKEELKLCGISTFFSTRKCRDNLRCLLDCRSQDAAEKMLAGCRNDLLAGRPLVHRAETLQGKIFYLFLALILYRVYAKRLAEVCKKHQTTMAECFKELQRIKLIQADGRWSAEGTLSPLHKDLLKAAKIPPQLDTLESWLEQSAGN